MNPNIRAAALLGIDALPVTIEVDLLRRLPQVVIVGLPASTVRETADRARSAILSSGFDFPRCRVVASLAPADLRKDGTGYDLAVAVGVLAANGACPVDRPTLFAAELSLAGVLRPVRGIRAIAKLAQEQGWPLICAAEQARDAADECAEVYGANTLSEVVAHFCGSPMETVLAGEEVNDPAPWLDFTDVRGNTEIIEQVCEAARTRRTILFVGPPGCGKIMLAARLPGLLPPLSETERLTLARIYDAAGFSHTGAAKRPFRAPHHTVSTAGLVGNSAFRPGEATLAHEGVLFLDEFAEFSRASLDVLSYVKRDRQVVLQRSAGRVVLPADFWLVAASNPCPCGMLGHPTRPCTCSEDMVRRYQERLEHPILKGALRIELKPLSASEVLSDEPSNRWRSTAELRERTFPNLTE